MVNVVFHLFGDQNLVVFKPFDCNSQHLIVDFLIVVLNLLDVFDMHHENGGVLVADSCRVSTLVI